MTRDQLQETVLQRLGRVAPEADLARLRPGVPIRDQLDLDSMDFLNFIIALHEELHVEVPEKDYAKLATLQGCVDYLLAASQAQRTHGNA